MKKKRKAKKQPVKRKKTYRLRKILLGTILVFVIVLGVGGYFLLTNINYIVKAAIEKYGSEATQTSVRVSRVKIDLKDGAGGIYGLTVANPRGFAAPHAFSLGEISTQINLKSIIETVKIIDKINIQAPQIYVEVNADHQINLNELQKNISKSASAASTPASNQESSEEMRLKIRRLRFAGGQIMAEVVPLKSKKYKLTLPSFTMTNLGGKNGGTPRQIANQILGELTNRALIQVRKKGVTRGIQKVKEKIKSNLKNKAVEKLKKLF
jgi:hypothetical protein